MARLYIAPKIVVLSEVSLYCQVKVSVHLDVVF